MILNALDWVLLAVVVLSMLLGIVRGFVREVISLAGWVVGIWLALRYAASVGSFAPFAADWPMLRTAVAAILIVVGCVFAAALTGWVVRELLAAAKLSAADRTLGGLFGLARGALIIALAVFVVRDTALNREPLWRESLMLPQIEAALGLALRRFPDAAVRGRRV